MSVPFKVMFLSPEVVPFAKTGGLADVAGALPKALKALGAEVRLCLPYYRAVREGGYEIQPCLKNLRVPLGDGLLEAQVLETQIGDGIPVYLIQREDLYDRPNLYGNTSGDYYDNLERYSFFAHAALLIAETLSFKPDLFHCHDWQTGLVPALLKGPYRDSQLLRGVPSIFTIHNLGYQGIFPSGKVVVTGLTGDSFLRPEGMEFWGKISLLKAGIVYSRAISTVSPTYAKEIQTKEFGMGMEGILHYRRSSLFGILNGVDYRVWDPASDRHLPEAYGLGKMSGKKVCKNALIQEMGLDLSLAERPLLGMISRLDRQKGLDLLMEIIDEILGLDMGLVVLGAGDEGVQESLRQAAKRHPGRVGLKFGFDEPLAHRIMGGADIFLIPSRYEPCGLTQMYALKYGTVPLVRATGGLEDTITQYDPQTGEGNGFKFGPYDSKAFMSAIKQATLLFQNTRAWKQLITRGMKADFSWSRSAQTYLELYQTVVRAKNG